MFLGVAQSLSQFTVKMQLNRLHLDELLKKDSKYIWDHQHQADFETIKKAICNPQRLSAFDPELDTILETDSTSRSGIGFVMYQVNSKGSKNFIMLKSKKFSSSQMHYDSNLTELLAISWAFEQCQYYLKGLSNFTCYSDNLGCVKASKKSLPDIENPLFRRLFEKISP